MSGINQFKNELRFANTIVRRKPFQCLLQVTNRCNMRCKFCDFWPNSVSRKEELDISDYRKLSRDLSQYGSLLISIEGGEPLVRDDLVELIGVLSRYHLPVLFTNGWYVDSAIAKALFANGLHQVGVSLDFSTGERHDAFRGVKGAFEKAISAVALFKRYAPRKAAQVHIISVLMRDNEDDIENLLQLSRSLGVGHQFTLLSNNGYRRKSEVMMPQSLSAEYLLSLRKRYSHLRTFTDYLRHVETFLHLNNPKLNNSSHSTLPSCRAGRQSFNIDHVGNVSACIEKIDKPVGNIRSDSIFDCVQRLADLKHVNGCQDCWTLCRGMTQSFSDSGNWRSWKDLILRRQSV